MGEAEEREVCGLFPTTAAAGFPHSPINAVACPSLRAEFGEQTFAPGDVEHPAEKQRGGDEVDDVERERPREVAAGQMFAAQHLAHSLEDVRGRDAERNRL